MSAISLKSITGITSITTPTGVDNQLTLHNNNTTEAVKLDIAGNLHFHNHLNITGISTAANFKTGTSNLHNTGLNVQDLDVDGHTNLDNVSIAGVTTFSHTGASQLIIKDSDTSGANSQQRISFRDSADTEMFFVGNDTTNSWLYLGSPSGQNNNIAFRVNGNDKFQVNGNGVYVGGYIELPDTILHSGDTDTKIRFPSADNISFETGGDERLRITSSGTVNIGNNYGETANLFALDTNYEGFPSNSAQPEAILLIKGRGSNNRYVGIGASNTGSWIQASGPGYSGPTSVFCINPAGGNVAIGHQSPNASLHVSRSGYQTLRLQNTDNGADGPYIELYNNSSSPADNDYTGILSFKNRNTNNEEITYSQIRSQSTDVTDGTEDGILTFHTRGNGTFGERLRITSDGTVHTAMTGTAPSWLGSTIATREKFSIFQGANFGEACFNIDVDNNNSFLSHNMYYDGGWKIRKSGSPVRHLEIGTDGWTFMTGADGSNDTGSALTNRFRIKPSGRVQILNNNEDIDMDSSSNGQFQIDGNGYTGAITLNDEAMFLYHNSSSRYIGIGVNETEVGRFSTGGYEQRFSNTSTYSSTTGSRKGIYVFNSGATTNCYASLELAANNGSGYFGSTILNSIATADTSYSNHFAIQLRHGGNYYERLRIASDGQVGINATDPQSMFEVAESSTGQSETQKRIAIFRKNGTAVGDEGYIHLTTMTGHYGVKLGFANEGASPTYLNQGFFISTVHGNENITNHQKRFVIKSNGNIGINQTDPSRARLHVVGDGSSATEIVAKFKGASGADARTKIGLAAAYSDTANDTEGQAYVGALRNGSGNTSSLFFEVSQGSSLKEMARIHNGGIQATSFRFTSNASTDTVLPNTHNIGDVSSNSISYYHNPGLYYVFLTCPTDGNWYTMFTSFNDSASNFRGICGDASSKNSFYWYFNPTSPSYGVNPYGEKWHHGAWNSGSVTFRLDGTHPNWNLQIKCTSYYGTNRTAQLRGVLEVYY